MAMIFKACGSTISGRYLEVNGDEMLMNFEISNVLDNSSISVSIDKEDVGELIKFLQRKYAKMED